jgi:uncharacterized protein
MSPAPRTQPRTVSVPAEFFVGLRQVTVGSLSPVDAVRDAGHAAGEALFDHFAGWLEERGEAHPHALPDERFRWLLELYFHELGWGRIGLRQLSDAVMVVETTDWIEAADATGCLVSTGLFAGFFGRLAGSPIGVLEVDVEQAGRGRSRFLLGSMDVLDYVWESMQRGVPYDRAAVSA